MEVISHAVVAHSLGLVANAAVWKRHTTARVIVANRTGAEPTVMATFFPRELQVADVAVFTLLEIIR